MKTRTPYLSQNPNGYRWHPPKKWRNLGYSGQNLGSDLKQAIRKCQTLNESASMKEKSGLIQPNGSTLQDVITACCESPDFNRLAGPTIQTKQSHFKRLLSDFGNPKLSEITCDLVQNWHSVSDIQPSTASAIADTLKALLRYAVKCGMLETYALTDLRLNRGARDISVWNDADVALLVKQADSQGLHWLGDAITLSLHTGQRKGDILRLKWDNIADGTLTLRQSKTGKLITFPLYKADGTAIDKTLCDRLQAIRKRTGSQNYIIADSDLQKIDTNRFDAEFRKLKTACKSPNNRFHDLRSTFATKALEKGLGINVVMSLTGHKSLENFQRYIGITDNAAEQALTTLWR